MKELFTMVHRHFVRRASGLVLAGGIAALSFSSACSSIDNVTNDTSCDEFAGGSNSIASLSIDGTTKQFLQAASDFDGEVSNIEASIYGACKGIDTDLGVTDTWSAMSTLDAQVNEACKQASTKIQAILAAGQSVQAACYLSATGGGCQVDASLEASCEAQCSGTASCTPPDVTVSCSPGDLSVICNGSCQANAVCEGSVAAAAQCQGSCSADCSGECDVTATQPTVHCEGTCSGLCTGTCDGSTASGTSCAGRCNGSCSASCTYAGGVSAHCDGSCKGTCTGDCKIDANASVTCGGSVRCKGGCSVMGTQPQCEGTVTPAKCSSDVNCQASCQSHAEAKAVCTAPTVDFECDATATADMQTLATTLGKNLPAILQVVETQGPLAVDAAGHVVSAGAKLVSAATTIGVKGAVCASTAASAAANASVSLNVSVMASASVSTSCGGPTGS